MLRPCHDLTRPLDPPSSPSRLYLVSVATSFSSTSPGVVGCRPTTYVRRSQHESGKKWRLRCSYVNDIRRVRAFQVSGFVPPLLQQRDKHKTQKDQSTLPEHLLTQTFAHKLTFSYKLCPLCSTCEFIPDGGRRDETLKFNV